MYGIVSRKFPVSHMRIMHRSLGTYATRNYTREDPLKDFRESLEDNKKKEFSDLGRPEVPEVSDQKAEPGESNNSENTPSNNFQNYKNRRVLNENYFAQVNSIDFRTIAYAQRMRSIGDRQPSWKAKAFIDGNIVDLTSSMITGKWSILLFYPLNFTFVCPTEINEASDLHDEFKKIETTIYGISVDSVYAHRIWSMIPRKDGGVANLKIPLVSDLDRNISRRFGILSKSNPSVANRATVILNPEGSICHLSINESSIGRNFAELYRLLKALQYTSVHGEVCPARWKEGEKAILPEPEGYSKWYRETNKNQNTLSGF